MATLHLLPRELLSLLARPTSSINAGSFRASSCSRQNLDTLLLLQWPRYRHKSSFDPALAREFDRPEAGFDFPGEKGVSQARFMEEEGAEYTTLSTGQASTGGRTSSTLSKVTNNSDGSDLNKVAESTHARSVEAHAYIMRIPKVRKLQTEEEILDMLAWFEHAPSLSSFIGDPSSRNQYSTYTAVIMHVSRKLVTLFPDDIDLLTRYASLAARKGFAIKLPVDFFAHISRFSTFERLQPFLSTFTKRTRRYVESSASSAKIATESRLRLFCNAVIRAQVLSARHVDALNVLREVRQLKPGGPVIWKNGVSPTPRSIEPFTYQLLFEEFSRDGVHPHLAKELVSLHKQDYPYTPSLPTQATKAHEAATVEGAYTAVQSIAVSPSSSFTRVKTHWKPKALYRFLKHKLATGTLPTETELSTFRQSCVSHNEGYLFRALSRSLQMSESQLLATRLRTIMQEGRLPAAKELAQFINGCTAARCSEVAHNLGNWMEQQSPRFQSLWRVARMYRLVCTGKVHNARLALRIYADSFIMLGVPEQVKESARNGRIILHLTDDIAPAKPKEKLWPSTHGITTAIRALFIQDKTPAYIMATYRSFIEASYASGTTLPLSSLPDQVSYDAFIQPLAKVGEPDMALEIMHEMRDRGIMPNRHLWDTLIGGYATYGRLDMVEAILSRMEKQVESQRAQLEQGTSDAAAMTPFFTQSTVDQAQGRESDSAHPLDAFQLPTPGIVTYTTVIRGLGIAGQKIAATQYRQRLYKATDESGIRLFKAGENSKTTKALEILASMDAFSAQRQRRLEMQGA